MDYMTLTELSYYSRKLLPFVLIFFIVFLTFFYMIKLLFVYLGGTKKMGIYTNTVFGKIKKPFVKDTSSSARFSFTLDTVEGEPVTATDSAKIFFLPPSAARFGYREKIYLMAKAFSFNTEFVKHKLVDKEGSFSDLNQSLSIDITNFNFTYKYKFEKKPDLFINATIPGKTVAENKAVDFLKMVGRYPDELAKGKLNTIFLNYNPQTDELNVSKRPQEANIVEVDLYRPDIDAVPQTIPIVAPKYFTSQNYVVMVFQGKDYKILKSQIRFFEKSDEQVGVYPLKDGNLAWSQLKEGKGIVVQTPKNEGPIVVKKMFMGYLDPDVYQDYLAPVYVFLGENNFVSYVSAVKDEYLSE